MNELLNKENIKVEDMIYEIRNKQVMLDSDLAKLYQCSNGTKTINQAVKRHINKFPDRFMFQLTLYELRNLWSQTGTANSKMIRTLPYAFTEEGVAMLATVLRTSVAEKISVAIMDAFVSMKKYISSNLLEQKYINNQVMKNTEDIKLLQDSFNKFVKNKECDGIFFEGQIYDSYSLLIDILNTSKKNIIIIDNYIDKNLLDILRKINKDILVVTNKYNNNDYVKYQKQFSNIKVKIDNSIHDRFIIIDEKDLYHCGASFKDLGKKCFAINKINNFKWLLELIEKIK